MEFTHLLEVIGDEPVIETSLLLAGAVDPADVRRQLSRWVTAGRLHQLRRGFYVLAPPYQRTKPHPFVVANAVVRGSYVSLQAALAHYGLIPEGTPAVTSVTTGRPGRWDTPLGVYEYRHVKVELFFGYRLDEVSPGQRAFIATPEKALLDLIHLTPGGDNSAYLQELRLQNLERLDVPTLQRLAEQAGSQKLQRASHRVADLVRAEAEMYEEL